MTTETQYLSLEAMRQDFDASFGRPRPSKSSEAEEFLVLRIGSSRFALRVREMGGLFRSPAVTPFPTSSRTAVGLVALKGGVVVVHDAAVLLGVRPSSRDGGWLVLLRADRSCALLFDAPEGYQRVERASIVTENSSLHESEERIRAFVSEGETIRLVESSRWEKALIGEKPLRVTEDDRS